MPQDHLAESLRVSGRRMTRQRQLVMEVLQESHEHLDVEMVYRRAKARDPHISLPTIYRTLTILKEMGLVEEHSLGESHAHYEAVKETSHYHFTCRQCGQVIEFNAPQIIQAVHTMSKQKHIQVTDIHLFLRGYCAQCRK